MSQAGVALRLHAIGHSPITDLIGERFRPIHDAQGDDFPRVTYQQISCLPDEGLHGDAGHETVRLQFNIYDNDSTRAHRISRLVRKRLLTAFGTLPIDNEPEPATIYVTGVSTAGGIRDAHTAAPADKSEQWLHGATFDLMVSYNPSE
ncbi:hypothetical protein [uncultured Maricaulis sp.]|uniref:hypothetical protein n=1 Tax=uncultured Maricaulis sp. TaxID=174710 RepID=UPI0030D90613|tara:strand:+ start:3542 stop:3985 length:444 start_codon:yes stop_codon:yes gene_type:complete